MVQKWYQKASVQVAIVTGVVGMVIVGINIWHNRSQLRKDNEKYINEIREKNDRIDKLEQNIEEKIAEIQRLETILTPFRTIALEKYTGSEQEALQKLAEDLKVLEDKTSALEKRLTPRFLTPEQISIIVKRINAIKDIKVHFLLIASDHEAKSFKEQIKEALKKGGWIIEKDTISGFGVFTGITLFASQDPPNEALKALYLSLKEFGLEPGLTRDKDLPENVIGIEIGKKK